MPPEHVSPVSTDDLATAAAAVAPAGEALLAGARDHLARWRLDARVRIPAWTDGRYARHTDPASGLPSLRADFFSAGGQRKGHLLFHANGSRYGEFDVCLPHPERAGWWIEAVEVWGAGDAVKSELRLLALPDDAP
jgi:hypothetical protein